MSTESGGIYLGLTEKNKIAITTRKRGEELRFTADPDRVQNLISELQRLKHEAQDGESE